MFQVNDDLSIYVTRGDIVALTVTANEGEEEFTFPAGTVLRFKLFDKKACENVIFQKDVAVKEDSTGVEIHLTEQDTRIGGVISKPKDYWYEVEMNPFDYPQTIVGYDEDGPKVFKLFPEGRDLEDNDFQPEEIPFIDAELDMTSARPIQNQAVARKFASVEDNANDHYENDQNPHNVTAKQVGLENVPNVATNDQTPTFTEASELTELKSGEKMSSLFGKLSKAVKSVISHIADKSNPHAVKAAQTGAVVADNNRKDIPAESDLNDQTFLEVGAWRCTLNKTAAGLLNCPTVIAFTLDCLSGTGHQNVITDTSGYLIQRITTHTGDVYFRRIYAYSTVGKVFGDWKHFYSDQLKPTLEEIGAAPAGYGLGGLSTYSSDPNNVTSNGFYYCDENSYGIDEDFKESVFIHINRSETEMVQIFVNTLGDFGVRRFLAGQWSEIKTATLSGGGGAVG